MGKNTGPQQIPETPEEKALAQIAAERWQDYQKNFVPMENRYMAQVSNIGEGEKQKVEGETSALTQQKVGAALGAARTNLARRGINPASGAAVMGTGQVRTAEGRALGLGNERARSAVEGARMRGLESIVDMGTGVKDTAQTGYAGAAEEASSEALQDAYQRDMENAQQQQMYGQLVGIGAGGLYHDKKKGWGWSINGDPYGNPVG